MAVQDKVITVKGSETVVTVVQLYPQADGSIVIVAAGGAKDATGAVVGLSEAKGRVQPNDAAIAPLMALALKALQHTNGLDDAPSAPLAPLEAAPAPAPSPAPVVLIPDPPQGG